MGRLGIQLSKSNKNMYSCDHDFFSRDTEESFYIAGSFAADGCVKQKRNKQSLAKDPDIVYMSLGIKDKDHYKIF